MAIFAIADLHLSLGTDKPMGVFGSHWEHHEEKISSAWRELIRPTDTVLIPGDISWAMTLPEALPDLRFLHELPGTKILSKGNHDYWWNSLKKLKDLGLSTIDFLQNNSFDYGNYSIAGSRGWIDKNHSEFLEKDIKVFDRELLRLELSLTSAKNKKIICMLHYPPFNEDRKPNEFGLLMEKFNVEICIYGHLHGDGLQNVVEGTYNGIDYKCASSDYLKFKPIIIGE